jgi:hypothetical protein
VHELSKTLDTLWRYDQYIANDNRRGDPEGLLLSKRMSPTDATSRPLKWAVG